MNDNAIDGDRWSVAVIEDSQALSIELGLKLLPLLSIQFFQTLAPQNFQFFVGLLELSIHVLLVKLIALADGVLFVCLVPFSVSSDGV